MSYDIEYGRKIFVDNKSEWNGEKEYFAMSLIGCNNVRPRPRGWVFVQKGWAYSIIAKVCHWAGGCEGGSLKLHGKDVTPENYIKLWRKVLANARPIEEFFSGFSRKEGYAQISKEKLKNTKWVDEKTIGLIKKNTTSESEEICEVTIPIKSMQDIDDWQNLKELSNWHYLQCKNGQER